jgi:predicted HicB family RNase H-like nuclease
MAEFQIKHDETLNKTIRMKKSLINEITMLAGKHEISFNALVVQMCEFALQHLPDKDKCKNENA